MPKNAPVFIEKMVQIGSCRRVNLCQRNVKPNRNLKAPAMVTADPTLAVVTINVAELAGLQSVPLTGVQ